MQAFWLRASGADPRKAATAAILLAIYGVTLWASLSLTGPDRVPVFWVCNAFIAAMVVLLRGPLLAPAVAAAAVLSLPMIVGDPAGLVAGTTRVLFNLGEGLLAGGLALHALGPRRLLRTASGFVKLQALAILPAVGAACVARELLIRAVAGPEAAALWRAAFLPHMLGLALGLPALLLAFQPTIVAQRRSWLETAAILAGLALATHLVFNVLRMPTGFVASPLLLMAAFRLGPRGAVFGHLAVTLVCLPATIGGGGSFSLHPEWTLQERANIYQGVALSSSFAVSFCAFIMAQQSRLKHLLVARAAAARDARRRALAASRSKTEFLATMSHEIRTPMNSILGFTQLLMANPDVSPAARDQVKTIAEAGGSLMTVLNDILDFSKVEAGQIELHLEAVDVEALAAATVEIMREPARAKGLTLRLECEAAAGRFELDGQRVRQVLLNLLNNAVKFTEEGHVLITVARGADPSRLRFEVRDTGIGIAEEVVGRLFTRFSQADSSTTRDYGGTGLGLAICKGLVERMGGAIGVESRPGAGSTFWFELPGEAVPEPDEAFADDGPARPLEGRVLLVDDHPMNLRLGETLLRLLGCDVDLAASGEEAVAAVRAGRYDAVLMDVHMPRMDGLAATRAIRALEGPADRVPVIAMSADVMAANLERCRQAGMVDHVDKPVQLPALHAVLRRWLVEQKQRSAA